MYNEYIEKIGTMSIYLSKLASKDCKAIKQSRLYTMGAKLLYLTLRLYTSKIRFSKQQLGETI